ncbi:MAG: hypothetical protein ACJAZN_000706 [Planctomycetota bacterium]|jgi:hypothetical protein
MGTNAIRSLLLTAPALLAHAAFGSVPLAPVLPGPVALAQHGGERALLMVDPSNPDALHIANVYAAARLVPGGNVLFLDPDAASYASLVAGPMKGVLGEIEQRGLDASVDFVILGPSDQYRTSASGLVNDQCVAVQNFGLAASYGLHDYQANLLTPGLLTASAITNQFVGSNWRGRSFRGADYWRNGAVSDPGTNGAHRMLIPARLGWTGSLGNTKQEVLDMIIRSVAADATFPTGSVYYMETTDIARSGPRHGLYPTAVTKVTAAGGAAEHLLDVLPIGRHDALGIMTGAANPAIDGGGYTLLSGSFADHLTSFAAHFGTSSQTKMSRWIAAGASGTSGAIEEPCNYPSKFPHPRIHSAYRWGVTLGEAWFRSRQVIPLQSMFLGDPLTQPWPMGPTVNVADAPQVPVSGVVMLTPSATPNGTTTTPIAAHELFVDGVLVQRVDDGNAFALDTAGLAVGPHELLVRSEDDSLVRHVGTWTGTLEVDGSVGLTLGVSPAAMDLDGTATLSLAATGGAVEEIVVRHLGRVVGALAAPGGQIELHGQQLGSGPVRLVAEARFAGGQRAISVPFYLDVNETTTGAMAAAPVAFGYRRALGSGEAFVLDLPAAFGGAPAGAVYEIVTPPARATVLTSAAASVVLEPNAGATGVDLVQFRVTTPAGSSEVATIQIEYAAQAMGEPELFCRTSPNVAGDGARMGWSGSASLASDDLVLRVAGLPAQSFGVMFRGQGFGEIPLGNGLLCATGSQVRLSVVQADPAGLVTWPVTHSSAPGTSATAGSTWGFQCWHRDVGGAAYGFSDGVLVTFEP